MRHHGLVSIIVALLVTHPWTSTSVESFRFISRPFRFEERVRLRSTVRHGSGFTVRTPDGYGRGLDRLCSPSIVNVSNRIHIRQSHRTSHTQKHRSDCEERKRHRFVAWKNAVRAWTSNGQRSINSCYSASATDGTERDHDDSTPTNKSIITSRPRP